MSEIRALSPALQAKAELELNEDPARRDADVAHIRDWLQSQVHINANNPSDQTLVAFLRGCGFDLERTKEKLDLYFTMRTALPEYFGERDIKHPKLKQILQLGLYLPLPGLDDEGRKVYIIRPGVSDPNIHSIEDQFKVNFMLFDWMIREDDDFMVSGMVAIMDMGNVTLGHGAQMSPATLKKLMRCSQDAYPLLPKEVNFLHTPAIFETIFHLFKSFANDNIKDKFFVHGSDLESLYKKVPRRMLPAEYGGDAGTAQEIVNTYMQRLEDYSAWFAGDLNTGVDEGKRPGQPKTHEQLFGLDASFRQLNVD